MTTIELFHLRRVRDKPRATALLAAHAGLTAEAALAAVHRAVGGGKPQITVADEDAARRLIAALACTGFIARRVAPASVLRPGSKALTSDCKSSSFMAFLLQKRGG